MSNKNCENMKNSDYCNYCYSCYSCNSCNSCYSCNYCNSCNYCYSCNSCNSCNYCNYCYSCNSCNYCNSCYFSAGLRMSEQMIFCSGDGRLESKGEGYQKHLRIFNQDVTEEEFSKAQSTRPSFELPVAKWVEKKDMTDEEKENWPSYSETGGFLRTLSYQDAWKEAWPKASKEFKDWVKNLPHFNSELFEKITGIKYENEVKEMTVSEISKALGFEVKVVK